MLIVDEMTFHGEKGIGLKKLPTYPRPVPVGSPP